MKTSINQIRWLSLMFIMIALFQSCRVYHVQPITLEQAVASEKRVKIQTNKQKTLKDFISSIKNPILKC